MDGAKESKESMLFANFDDDDDDDRWNISTRDKQLVPNLINKWSGNIQKVNQFLNCYVSQLRQS